MVQAVRSGAVAMVNALGSGILETRALLAFLPAIARTMTGGDLALPSVATWWCGQPEARRHVADNIDRMTVGRALSTRLPFEDGSATVIGSALDAARRAELLDDLARDGGSFVGQEAVTLSTTPVFLDGKLEPRPASLRVYLARTVDGWAVMPGGFARVGVTTDTTAMQQGGRAADVWVVSRGPVERDTLLAAERGGLRRSLPGSLPSRAAENLLWLGRYIERAEDSVRILRAYHIRLAETSDRELPLLADMRLHMQPLGVDLDEAIPAGLVRAIDSAVHSAGQIRDRFSPDGWLALRDLSRTVHQFAQNVTPGDDATRAMTVLLRKLSGFSGLLHENMYRFTGWRFLEIGRRLERGMAIARTLSRLTREDAPDGALDMMLEIGDSVLTHRRQYAAQAGRRTLIDLLALDALNPRSVLFQLDRLKAEIDLLPGGGRGQMSEPSREALRIHTVLAIQQPAGIGAEALDQIADDLASLYLALSRTYFG